MESVFVILYILLMVLILSQSKKRRNQAGGSVKNPVWQKYDVSSAQDFPAQSSESSADEYFNHDDRFTDQFSEEGRHAFSGSISPSQGNPQPVKPAAEGSRNDLRNGYPKKDRNDIRGSRNSKGKAPVRHPRADQQQEASDSEWNMIDPSQPNAILQGIIYSEILNRRPVKHYRMRRSPEPSAVENNSPDSF